MKQLIKHLVSVELSTKWSTTNSIKCSFNKLSILILIKVINTINDEHQYIREKLQSREKITRLIGEYALTQNSNKYKKFSQPYRKSHTNRYRIFLTNPSWITPCQSPPIHHFEQLGIFSSKGLESSSLASGLTPNDLNLCKLNWSIMPMRDIKLNSMITWHPP